jgi:curved DNA-binding protein CbpA
MSQVSEAEVFRACRTLFGSDLQLSHDFLNYLQPDGVRSAYRKKAKVVHPDKFSVAAADVMARQKRLFQDLNHAHHTVLNYLEQRQILSRSRHYRSRSRSTSQQSQRHEAPKPRQHNGPLPAHPLQFGIFLYYRGVIPFKTLINAIAWQRQQRPNLGDIAKRWGWLNDEQIKAIIFYRGGTKRFGEKAEKLGMLTASQVRTMLYYQRTQQLQLGQYFIRHNIFDETALNQYLQQLSEHNSKYRQYHQDPYYYCHQA